MSAKAKTSRAARTDRCRRTLIEKWGSWLVLLVVALFVPGQTSSCSIDLDSLFTSPEESPQEAAIQISPTRGSVLGRTQVTIVGTNTPGFGSGTEVLFGAFLGSDVQVLDASTLRVTSPAQPAGRVDVRVRLGSGETVSRLGGFDYLSMEEANGEVLDQIEAMYPGQPSVVSAVATSNTSVRVTFSEPVRDDAADPSNYSIVISAGGVLLVDRSKQPVLSSDHTVVDIRTLSQSAALYQLTATGIHDFAGNTIAPPDMLINPAEATFTGIPPSTIGEQVDSDGDGQADWFEMAGWALTVELANGQRAQSHVYSDPYNPDTDGDGVSDSQELIRGLDPRSNDTDADGVTDAAEINEWRSNPCDQDSDDDGLADATELDLGTSPILADTDGDQLADADELFKRNRNPLIADLPIPVITVGEMTMQLDERYTYSDQFGREQQISQSYSDSVQRDTTSSQSLTASHVAKAHLDLKIGSEIGGEWGKGDLGPVSKFHAKLASEVSAGAAYEYTNSQTWQSSQHAARTYNEAVNRVSQLSSTSGITRQTVGARLSGAVTLGAGSDIAFQLADLELSVLQQDPDDRSRLVPIATLVAANEDAVYHVGPLVAKVGPLVFENREIFPSLVESLMKDPRGLLFQVANFNITDELGRNFAFTGQEIVERTAQITIDFGNGESESYRIATAGRFNAQGRPLGISMADALRATKLVPWEGEDAELGSVDNPADTRPKPTDANVLSSFGMRTRPTSDGQPLRVVTRVRGVQDDFQPATVEPAKANDGGFWLTFASLPSTGGSSSGPMLRGITNFDEVRLHAGEAYIIAFVKDKDRDLLTSLEEFISGSSDTRTDTDRDNLGDFLEVRGQWNEAGLGAWLVHTDRLPGGYRTYGAPYLTDSDEDGLRDDVEYALCRYRYNPDGSVPGDMYAIGTYDDTLTAPADHQVNWQGGTLPSQLPPAFPSDDDLPANWHTQLDPLTGLPRRFPDNRASLDPRKMDTDEDGISDADEVNGFYLDLFDDDPTNGIRTRIFVRTDPLSTDTDGDGLLDGMERQFGTNPASADSGTIFDDDLDGLPNRVEETGWLVLINGTQRRVFSDPNDPDSDNDDLPDYLEWVIGTSPWYYEGQTLDPDLPAPGYDTDEDGLNDAEEWNGTVPPQKRDKLAFCTQVPNCMGYTVHAEPTRTDPAVSDTDEDGLTDGVELTGRMIQVAGRAAYHVTSDPLVFDADNDGLSDGAEAALSTDPNKPDTDGDNTLDLVERDQTDTAGKHRNPLAPDQRVTISYDGYGIHVAPGTSDPFFMSDIPAVEFNLGIWRLTPMPPFVSWVTVPDVVSGVPWCDFQTLDQGLCKVDCNGPKLYLWNNWLTFGSGIQRSLIMSDGDAFYLRADLVMHIIHNGTPCDLSQSGFDLQGENQYTVPLEGPIQYFELKWQPDLTKEDKFYFLGRILVD